MMSNVLYRDGSTTVELGDEVEFRGGPILLFRKFVGRVVYVPGVSPPNPDMEFNGLKWIGIDVPGKVFVKDVIDPETNRLMNKTKFLRRNSPGVSALRGDVPVESDN